jgi:hypothetical protein
MPTLAGTAALLAVFIVGPAAAQKQQQIVGTAQFCIKGASGPIKCEYPTMAQCDQAKPQGSNDQCVERSEAQSPRGSAPSPGTQKD